MEDIMQICSHFSSVFKVKLAFKYLWFFSYVIYCPSRLEFPSQDKLFPGNCASYYRIVDAMQRTLKCFYLISYRERGESVAHLELKETEYVAGFFCYVNYSNLVFIWPIS